jgi:hypothetical protein
VEIKMTKSDKDYHPRDIYNMDETGLFFSGLWKSFIPCERTGLSWWETVKGSYHSVMLCKYDWGEGTVNSYWKITTTKVFW